MKIDLKEISGQTGLAVEELLDAADLSTGQILVVGCSTSEIQGIHIGSSGSEEIAAAVLDRLMAACHARQIYLAVQCCEHLNRALVIEKYALRKYTLEEVSVVPAPKAGGALAARAFRTFNVPVVVEHIKAHAGLDIGGTLIGMHLKHVAVPIRLKQKYIGQAPVVAAKTRPKLIGGCRAIYTLET